jgi:hypothetical protein
MILVTLMMEAMRSSETSGFTSVTRRNIPEDAILRSLFLSNTAKLWLMNNGDKIKGE